MNYHYFDDSTSAVKICILVPIINVKEINKNYISPYALNPADVIAIDFPKPTGKKAPVKDIKQYVTEELIDVLEEQAIQYVLCADADYFKVLAGVTKADVHVGYVMASPHGKFKVIYIPNYKAVFYNPEKVTASISAGITAMLSHMLGTYTDPGTGIIKHAHYPSTLSNIKVCLDNLLARNCPLTCDIEAFSLKHHTAGIATISFAWSDCEGIAFAVDYVPIAGVTEAPYGINVRNQEIRNMLADFFRTCKQKIIYHNIAYDAYVLIYQLFMEHLIDTKGLLEGIKVMLKDWDDTKLISYLATNSCAGNKLGLKDQAQEFAGNYAEEDIKDVLKIPLPKLLEYNLVDCLSTWYVHEKHYQTLVDDQQLEIYETLFKPATVDIIQMQLTGMPLNMARVFEVEKEMEADRLAAMQTIRSSLLVQEFTRTLNEEWVATKNATYKKKRVTLADANEKFNPASSLQLQKLLFDQLGLPVISLTDSKQPSTDGDTLKALVNHAKNPLVVDLLKALQDYKAVEKILSSFIPAMKEAGLGPDGWHYLFGNFNLGGTVSGRLSSSNPNLQNLPAKSKYGKLIKSCFQAPPGWIFVGLDFSSLEDRVSALTTRDKNKLKVYLEGYDGHSLRAFSYYREQMPDIEDNVISINSIEKAYPHFRQESKAPTFALTYQGTFITLVKNCGFSEEKAKLIEARYHELYQESDAWVASKLDQASKDGYITAAFGLRLRTPLLHQVIRKNSRTPYEAEAEGRTAGNALGQSYCLLNSRAWVATMRIVRTSEFAEDIRPCAQIHDAGYALVRDDIDPLMFLNEHLVREVNWNDSPDIYHPEVGLGGELSVFYPSWKQEIGIPNHATKEEILAIVASLQ